MKKAIVILAMVCGVSICANAQTVNPLDEVDAAVKNEALLGHNAAVEKSLSHYTFIQGEYVGNNTDEMVGETLPIYSMEVYAVGDYAHCDKQGQVQFGIGFIYRGKTLGVGVEGLYGKRKASQYSDRDESFNALEGRLTGYVKVLDSKDHRFRLDILGGLTYSMNEVNKDLSYMSNEYVQTGEVVLRAHTLGWRAGFRAEYVLGFMSRWHAGVEAWGGTQQTMEMNNPHHSMPRFGGSVFVSYNIGKHVKESRLSAKTGRLISQY